MILTRPLAMVGLLTGLLLGGRLWAAEVASEAPAEQAPLQVAQAPAAGAPDAGLVSLNFRDAELSVVLEALARKAKINIVAGKEVVGSVSISLQNVSWEQALDAITKTYGYGYEKEDNVILVTTLEELKARREKVKDLVAIEPVITKVIQLKYLDASDVKKFLEPQLTAQGKISVLEITGQKGWAFGSTQAGSSSTGTSAEPARKERESARSKAIVITDTPTTVDRLEKVLAKIDVMPKQILIEARIMEVSRNLLRDINPAVTTGATAGSTSLTMRALPAAKVGAGVTSQEFAAAQAPTAYTPSIFGPLTSGLTAEIAGGQFFYQKLMGTQFAALVKFLEEDVRTNTLSAPHILTLSGQEARILVGTKYPILQTQVSGTTSTTTTTTLAYYQDIGIEMFVVPQIAGDRHIDMIIHPVVSSRTGTVGSNAYPILDVRETETQVVIGDGDTVVIGGLLKDVKSKSRIGWPWLGKIPVLDLLFTRSTTDLSKIDLLIFITARILEPGTLSPEELERLQHPSEEGTVTRPPRRGRSARPPSSSATPVSSSTPSSTDNHGFLHRSS